MMPVSRTFKEHTDWRTLHHEIHAFGDVANLTEDDLISALAAVDLWPERFTDKLISEYRGEQITWFRYELLIWTLGESFRRIMIRDRELRKRERVFEAVSRICRDRRFGKGRESFTMLLGHYGGTAQIPVLIQLLDDADVSGHSVYALRLLGTSAAADRVRPFLNSPKAWVRKEARKYFQKIEPASR